MKKSVLLFLLSSLLYFQSHAQIPAGLVFRNETYDFGEFGMGGENLTALFICDNTSSDSIAIESISSSCACIKTEYSKGKIPPGGCGYVTAMVSTKENPGNFERNIFVISRNGIRKLTMKGTESARERIKTSIKWGQTIVDAGIIPASSTKELKIKFTNKGGVPYLLGGIVQEGGNFTPKVDYTDTIPCKQNGKFLFYNRIIRPEENGVIVVTLDNKTGHPPKGKVYTTLVIWGSCKEANPMRIPVKAIFK